MASCLKRIGMYIASQMYIAKSIVSQSKRGISSKAIITNYRNNIYLVISEAAAVLMTINAAAAKRDGGTVVAKREGGGMALPAEYENI